MRRLNDRLEVHPLLKNVVVPLVRRNGVNVSLRGRELDADSGEGVERFEQEALVIDRHNADLVEEDSLRHAWVLEVRNGKLADPEIPVGMARPFDVKFIAQVEGQSRSFALQFVHDAAVVD